MITKNNVFLIIFTYFLLIVLAGCDRNDGGSPLPNKKDISVKEKVPAVIINNVNYYVEDIINYAYYTISEMTEENIENPKVKKEIIKNFINHKLMLKEAKKNGVSVKEYKVEEVLKNFETAFGKENLSTYTKRAVLDVDRLRNLIEEQLIIQKFLRNKVSDIKINEEDIKDYYNEYIKGYEGVTLYHIYHLVTREKEKADKARRLMRQRTPFRKVAEKYSVGPSRKNGGDLGYIDITNYPEPFHEVKNMRIGEVSDVIKSDYGYHIFKLVDIQKNVHPGFDEMKSKLYSELFIIKHDEIVNNLIKELRSNAKIVVNDNVSFNIHDSTSRVKDSR